MQTDQIFYAQFRRQLFDVRHMFRAFTIDVQLEVWNPPAQLRDGLDRRIQTVPIQQRAVKHDAKNGFLWRWRSDAFARTENIPLRRIHDDMNFVRFS